MLTMLCSSFVLRLLECKFPEIKSHLCPISSLFLFDLKAIHLLLWPFLDL